jgi:hypothetical protein
MKPASAIALVLLAIVLGGAVASGLAGREAHAQAQQPVQINPVDPARFQISAYAGPTKDGHGHGCYIIDTSTGEVWHALYGGQLEKVSGKVR